MPAMSGSVECEAFDTESRVNGSVSSAIRQARTPPTTVRDRRVFMCSSFLVRHVPFSHVLCYNLLEACSCLSGGLANGSQQRIGGSSFLHKRDGTSRPRSHARLPIGMDTQDHDGALWDHRPQGCCGLDAIHPR